jgi:hypothetical protein
MPAILTPLSTVETEYTLVGVDGISHALTEAVGYIVTARPDGQWGPDVDFVESVVPGRNGAYLRTVNVPPSDIDLPVFILGETHAQRISRSRQLAGWLNPARGDVTLQISGSSGASRGLTGRGQLIAGGERWPTGERFTLALHAHDDPYWSDTDETTATYQVDQDAVTWVGRAWVPFRVQSSAIFNTTTVLNDGDVDAYPSWTITGPGSSISLVNVTTGKALPLSVTLGAGEVITVTTDPGTGGVVADEHGEPRAGIVPFAASFWALVPGSQSIQVEMADATEDSSVVLAYRRRWLTPPD